MLAVGSVYKADGKVPAYAKQQNSRTINVTLALTPEEAGLLAFAQENGKLQLSLRAPTEQRVHILETATWDSLSQYVLDHQGTRMVVPQPKPVEEKKQEEEQEEEPTQQRGSVQIFRGGRETGF